MKRQHLYLPGVLLAVAAGLPGTLPAFAQEQYNAGVLEQNTGY